MEQRRQQHRWGGQLLAGGAVVEGYVIGGSSLSL